MMKIERDRLIEMDRFSHADVVNFIKEKALTKTWLTQVYKVLTLGTLLITSALLTFMLVVDFKLALIDLGIVCVSIPLWVIAHEGLHGVAYKCIGAKKVEFAMVLRRFIFFTIVYEELFSFKQLIPVLLAPAILLLTVPLWLLWVGQPLIAVGLFCFHVLSIGGDLYLLNYYLLNKHLNLYTEDLRTQVTLIYREA